MEDNATAIRDGEFDEPCGEPAPMLRTTGPCITITGATGKEICLHLTGDELTISGDLPVSDGAKVFFDCVKRHYEEWLKLQGNE